MTSPLPGATALNFKSHISCMLALVVPWCGWNFGPRRSSSARRIGRDRRQRRDVERGENPPAQAPVDDTVTKLKHQQAVTNLKGLQGAPN